MRITKRQLLQIIKEEKARLFEQEEVEAEASGDGGVTVGVEDVSKSADNFGGGDVEEEIFVDADEELLNQNTDPGEVPTIEVIPERAKLKRKLRKLVREAAGAGAGLPAVDDLAKKLGAAGAEEAMSYLKRLLDKVSFGVPEEVVEEPALPPELPPADDMVPPDEV